MKQASKTFSYTSQRASYLSTVCALMFIMVAELSLIVLLIAKFIQIDLIKFGLIGAFVVLFLNIGIRLLAPLWTKHHLTEASLHLHFGLEFKAEIPRSAIVTARLVCERVALPQARYEAEKERIFIAFSDQGQVLLVLDQSYQFRVGLFGSSKPAHQLLLNVDNRDAFLADLDLLNASAKQPGSSSGKLDPDIPISLRLASAPTLVDEVKFAPAATIAIRTEHLTRQYHDLTVVEDLSIAVAAGEIYGFLGSNGAGKTTTMKMLVGLLKPGAGRVLIADHDVWAEPNMAKSAFGYVADRSMLYDRLTGREFLEFLAQLRGIAEQDAKRRIGLLLDILELGDRADTACGTYSFGMKRKLAVAGALIHEPQVLILDEPLNGLDPLSTRRLKDVFAELASHGTTILLSTHDLATAETLCHRIGIIQKGRLLVEGSSSELSQLAGAPGLEEAFLSLTADGSEVQV